MRKFVDDLEHVRKCVVVWAYECNACTGMFTFLCGNVWKLVGKGVLVYKVGLPSKSP